MPIRSLDLPLEPSAPTPLQAVGQRMPLIVSMEGALRSDDMTPMPAQRAPEVAKQVLAAVAAGSKIEALGFNCASPEHILAALVALKDAGLTEELRKAGVQLATYANINDNQERPRLGRRAQRRAGKPQGSLLRLRLRARPRVAWAPPWLALGGWRRGAVLFFGPARQARRARQLPRWRRRSHTSSLGCQGRSSRWPALVALRRRRKKVPHPPAPRRRR